jgi:hypothetical protein
MSTKFFFRIWIVICGLAFCYGYVRRITLGELQSKPNYSWEISEQKSGLFDHYNWFDKIIGSIEDLISFGHYGLAFRITWGVSTLIVVGLSALILGLAFKWVRDSIPTNEKS